jgi:hypothetical protein
MCTLRVFHLSLDHVRVVIARSRLLDFLNILQNNVVQNRVIVAQFGACESQRGELALVQFCVFMCVQVRQSGKNEAK